MKIHSAAIATATTVKAAGVKLFAVGFGGARESTMRSIASAPSSDFAFFGSSLDEVRAHFSSSYLCGLTASPKAPPPPSAMPSRSLSSSGQPSQSSKLSASS